MVKNVKNNTNTSYDDVDAISDFVRLSTIILSEPGSEHLDNDESKNPESNDKDVCDKPSNDYKNDNDMESETPAIKNLLSEYQDNQVNVVEETQLYFSNSLDISNSTELTNSKSYDVIVPIGLVNSSLSSINEIDSYNKIESNKNNLIRSDVSDLKSQTIYPVGSNNIHNLEVVSEPGSSLFKTNDDLESKNNNHSKININDQSYIYKSNVRSDSKNCLNPYANVQSSINIKQLSSQNLLKNPVRLKNSRLISNENMKFDRHAINYKTSRLTPNDNVKYDRHVINYSSLSNGSTTRKPVKNLGTIKIQGNRFGNNLAFRKYSKSNKVVDVLYIDNNKEEPKESTLIECLDKIKENTSTEHDTSHKFFIGSGLFTIHIKDTFEIHDYKNRNLFDNVQRPVLWGNAPTNIVRICEDKLFIYKSEPIQRYEMSGIDTNEDEYLPSPNNSDMYYPLWKVINLGMVELYVEKSMSFGEKLQFYLTCCLRKELVCVRDMEIVKIIEDFDQYILEYRTGGISNEVKIPNLCFSFISRNEKHTFKCDSPINFMKWLTVVQLRKENVSSNLIAS